MTSQVLSDTTKLAEDIVSAVETHGGEVDAGVTAKLSPALHKGEHVPAIGLILTLATRRVQTAIKAYTAAERALDAERADDVAPRAERDRQAVAVYEQLKTVKGAVEGIFGAKTVGKLQIPAVLPHDPSMLVQAAGNVVEALGTVKLPDTKVPGVGKIDASVWATAITTPLELLKTARAKVNQEDKELIAALAVRDAAAQAANVAMVDALGLARAFAGVAGKTQFFDGLRATIGYGGAAAAPNPPATPVDPAAPK